MIFKGQPVGLEVDVDDAVEAEFHHVSLGMADDDDSVDANVLADPGFDGLPCLFQIRALLAPSQFR